MELFSFSLDGIKLINFKKWTDNRGIFSEVFNKKLQDLLKIKFFPSQVNFSHSFLKGTVRGLHYQVQPFEQGKFVWVIQGELLDVIVDIRKNSPCFGQHIKVNLRADRMQALYIPAGFAHGFCTLESDTKVCYMVTASYSPEHEKGLLWNDPTLAIDWPISEKEAILSDKDRKNSLFQNYQGY